MYLNLKRVTYSSNYRAIGLKYRPKVHIDVRYFFLPRTRIWPILIVNQAEARNTNQYFFSQSTLQRV